MLRTTTNLAALAILLAAGISAAADTVPKAFSFSSKTNVSRNILLTSGSALIDGIDAPSPISINGGAYAIECSGPFTSTSGFINRGQHVCVQHTTASGFNTLTTTTLTIGGASGTFKSTTVVQDTTPKPFSFVNLSNVPQAAVRDTPVRAITGINDLVTVTLGGDASALYSIDGAPFTRAPGQIGDGQNIALRMTASALGSTTVSANLSVGGAATVWSITTAPDTTPNAFTFTDQSNVSPGSVRTTSAATIGGITQPVKVTVSGNVSAEYSINGNAYTSATGSIGNSQTIVLHQTASQSGNATTVAHLTVGTYTTDWAVTSGPDDVPNAYSFVAQNAVPSSSLRTSNTVTIKGLAVAAPISVTGGSYSIGCTASFTTAAGSISNNQKVCVQHTSKSKPAGVTQTMLSISGVSAIFSSTTESPALIWDQGKWGESSWTN